jgi:hypothetical protein
LKNKEISMVKNKESKIALIKTINGDFEVEFSNSRDFINGLRTSIERGSIYEFTEGGTRTLINCKNIVSIELASEALAPASPFKAISQPTPEQVRETQLAMQPDILKFEAKKAAMEKMKVDEDARRQAQISSIYSPPKP